MTMPGMERTPSRFLARETASRLGTWRGLRGRCTRGSRTAREHAQASCITTRFTGMFLRDCLFL